MIHRVHIGLSLLCLLSSASGHLKKGSDKTLQIREEHHRLQQSSDAEVPSLRKVGVVESLKALSMFLHAFKRPVAGWHANELVHNIATKKLGCHCSPQLSIRPIVMSLNDIGVKDANQQLSIPDEIESVLATCAQAVALLNVSTSIACSVQDYLSELLAYNAFTNVYSKTAYEKLPFHVADSLALALEIRDSIGAQRGVLDLGSGSGLPSVLIACVNPELPVFAVESKSRKTRFLQHVAECLKLEAYTPLTQNVVELSRSWVFDADVVTAKAFKPLPEVKKIAQKCIETDSRLLVPISEAQVQEFSITEDKVLRSGEFKYFSQAITPSRGTSQRKLVTSESARSSRL